MSASQTSGTPIAPEERELLATHWGWDLGGWALTRDLSRRLRASAIGGIYSRLWIDLNRRVDDPTLVRKVAGGVRLSWNRRVGPAEIERRALAEHCPIESMPLVLPLRDGLGSVRFRDLATLEIDVDPKLRNFPLPEGRRTIDQDDFAAIIESLRRESKAEFGPAADRPQRVP